MAGNKTSFTGTESTQAPDGQTDLLEEVHSHPPMMYLMTFGVVSIIVLTVVLAGLICYYCTRVRNQFQYTSKKTIIYKPLRDPTQSEDEAEKPKRPRRETRGGPYPPHIYKPPGGPRSVPVSPHLDISAGHLLLSYIEENLQNQNKLQKEWENLQRYTPEAVSTTVAMLPANRAKNRYPDALPYDHSRVKLSPENSADNSDYINATFIVDSDPAHPQYITTQGPLPNTVAAFWQMVWEQNVSVIVMLTTLTDMGLSQSCQYWPSSGVETYHTFEVRLVSEHPHSEDYIIRSFYLQNLKARESRTVTQFQYKTWNSLGAPFSATPLLEFRRKVNKAHTRQDTPLLVHCSGGVGRTGTYVLIDMALRRIQSGAKEMNLAATVEHLRDQRPHTVKTKTQFEFALTALVEETHAMLDAARLRHFH